MPRDPMPPAPMNPKGFMESDRITSLDDEVLVALESSWFDWRPLPSGWEESAPAREFRNRAQGELTAVYGDAELFVMKDPRICRLVPVWSEVLTTAGCEPVFVCTHRDPREVAASLDEWAGYDPAYSQLLWLRHVLDAEAATRGRPRTFTSYTHLMRDWRGAVERIAGDLRMEWPHSPDAVADAVEAFLDDDLQRSVIEHGADEGLSPWIATAFEVFESWAATGEDEADHVRLDVVRQDLNHATPAFMPVVASGREADIRTRRLTEEVEAIRSAFAGLQVEQAARQAEQERLVTELRQLRLSEDELRAELDRAHRDRTMLHRQASAEMRRRVLESLTALTDAQESVIERDAQVRTLRRQRNRLRRELDKREAQLAGLTESRSWRVTAPLRRLAALSRKPEEAGWSGQ